MTIDEQHLKNQVMTNGFDGNVASATLNGPVEVICGPLLNYKGTYYERGQSIWRGSVLIVTKPGATHPSLELSPLGPYTGDRAEGRPETFRGVKLYEDLTQAFWRFELTLPLGQTEVRWRYTIPDMHIVTGVAKNTSRAFVVPPAAASMRIMFHSCNGFSVGTDEDAWSGPALWSDVMRLHVQRPFHVMIGGGDQIYNDGVRVDGPLKAWTAIANPRRRRDHPFDEQLRVACDKYYFHNYVRWYSTEPFASANAQIPQVNIWDDHDIIDGFGSYTDHFMQCPVFRGIGGVSFKYYCLFQQHIAPPKSTFTTDSPQTMTATNGTAGIDPRQTKNTFVFDETDEDPSFIIGRTPGPYVEERSRSLYMRLGKAIAFAGIDARTERSRHEVNYPETYDLIFSRLSSELKASGGEIKHLIFLLGVPIAYPRLAWLENLFTSPLVAPIRLLNKRFGLAGGLFNHFDGQIDLLDDLDDHYTARNHKKERLDLMHRLQTLAQQFSVRITILGGDVHLAALGRFYSNPKLNLPAEQDHRYMANIISSAITNKPPPKPVANLLARRNKIHHLDHDTDETLMKMFDKQPGGKEKGAEFNKVTMPSRNYACITEVPPATANGTRPSEPNGIAHTATSWALRAPVKDGHSPLHRGEEGAGVNHSAASGVSSDSGMVGGLDVSIRVEIDQTDREGRTEGYGFSIPPLVLSNHR